MRHTCCDTPGAINPGAVTVVASQFVVKRNAVEQCRLNLSLDSFDRLRIAGVVWRGR